MEREYDSDAPDPRQLFSKRESAPSVPCHVIHALMPAMSGGDLEPKTAEVLERHTRECLSCRRERMRFDSARAALSSLAPDAPETSKQFDEDFFASLRSGIVGELRRDSQRVEDAALLRKSGHSPLRSRLREWAPAAFALAATLIGGIWVGRTMQDPGPALPAPGITSTPGVRAANGLPKSEDPATLHAIMRLLRHSPAEQSDGMNEEALPLEALGQDALPPRAVTPVNAGKRRDY